MTSKWNHANIHKRIIFILCQLFQLAFEKCQREYQMEKNPLSQCLDRLLVMRPSLWCGIPHVVFLLFYEASILAWCNFMTSVLSRKLASRRKRDDQSTIGQLRSDYTLSRIIRSQWPDYTFLRKFRIYKTFLITFYKINFWFTINFTAASIAIQLLECW